MMFSKAKINCSSESQAKEKLAFYVYEYLLHCGAQKSAQMFLSEIRWDKQMSIGDAPGFLMSWWCIFWDLYCAAPERRESCEHSNEAKAFHDYGFINQNFVPNGIPNAFIPSRFTNSRAVRLPGGPEFMSVSPASNNAQLLQQGRLDQSAVNGVVSHGMGMNRLTSPGSRMPATMTPIGGYGSPMRPQNPNQMQNPALSPMSMGNNPSGSKWANMPNAGSAMGYSASSPVAPYGNPLSAHGPPTPVLSGQNADSNGDMNYALFKSMTPGMYHESQMQGHMNSVQSNPQDMAAHHHAMNGDILDMKQSPMSNSSNHGGTGRHSADEHVQQNQGFPPSVTGYEQPVQLDRSLISMLSLDLPSPEHF